jgi:hypothetical protein
MKPGSGDFHILNPGKRTISFFFSGLARKLPVLKINDSTLEDINSKKAAFLDSCDSRREQRYAQEIPAKRKGFHFN